MASTPRIMRDRLGFATMDALAGLVDGPRARAAFLLRSVLDPPWALRIEDEAPLTLVTVARGGAWILPGVGAALPLGPGDVALVRGPDHYTIGDKPGTRPQVVIHPGQRCTTLAGEDLVETMRLGVRTWGHRREASTVLLTGTYPSVGAVGQRLVDALPPVLRLTSEEWDEALLPLLASEVVRDQPGQEAVLDRLLDLVLIAVLRAWCCRPGGRAPSWARAQVADRVVGRALGLLHHNPAHPWTVASLAAASGVSRAALARRFTELVGEPPMTYLAGWRLALTADLLHESDATLGAIARQVGYGTPFALSAAFKRVRGVSPQQHRATTSAAA